MPSSRIIQRLLATPAITKVVGDNVRPMHKYQGEAGPYITVKQVSLVELCHTLGGLDAGHVRIQIDAWADSYGDVQALGHLIRNALRGFTDDTGSPVIIMTIFDGGEDEDEGILPGESGTGQLHRVRQDWLVDYSY